MVNPCSTILSRHLLPNRQLQPLSHQHQDKTEHVRRQEGGKCRIDSKCSAINNSDCYCSDMQRNASMKTVGVR